ncbi:hypothetical protein [Sinorhizobium fredii]|nr:hypothetical protein [Sinorhizobium fredii]
MFDRTTSAHWRIMSVPHVELASLRALARFLEKACAPSQSGEMSMPRQFTTYQFDLLSGLHSERRPAMPQWQALPEEARQALTALIVRLLVDHANGESASQKEAGHDA